MRQTDVSQLFLVLTFFITLASLIAVAWIVHDLRQVGKKLDEHEPAPYVIPPSSAQKPKQTFEIPPPPF